MPDFKVAYYKIIYIAKGWYKFLFCKKSQMAEARLTIFLSCKSRKGFICGECGCVLVAKAEVIEETCPKGLWK